MTFQEKRDAAEAFAGRLYQAVAAPGHDRGERGELRRLLCPAPVPTRAYWHLDPPRGFWPRELPEWLAGLAATRPASIAKPAEHPRRPGETLCHARDAIQTSRRGGRAFERHITMLLDCHSDDLCRYLVPIVDLAASASVKFDSVKFDYGTLLLDLSRWEDPARRAQRAWATDLWAPATLSSPRKRG